MGGENYSEFLARVFWTSDEEKEESDFKTTKKPCVHGRKLLRCLHVGDEWPQQDLAFLQTEVVERLRSTPDSQEYSEEGRASDRGPQQDQALLQTNALTDPDQKGVDLEYFEEGKAPQDAYNKLRLVTKRLGDLVRRVNGRLQDAKCYRCYFIHTFDRSEASQKRKVFLLVNQSAIKKIRKLGGSTKAQAYFDAIAGILRIPGGISSEADEASREIADMLSPLKIPSQEDETTADSASAEGGVDQESSDSNLIGFPELPYRPVLRPDVAKLAEKLISTVANGSVDSSRPPNSGHTICVSGMTGLGKSVTVNECCRLPDVNQMFRDGLLWIFMGRDPDPRAIQTTLAHRLGKETFTSTGDWRNDAGTLTEVLKSRNCLIVVDDVWDKWHIEMLGAIGPKSAMIITTQVSRLARELMAVDFPLQPLTPDVANQVLAFWAETDIDALPSEAKEVAALCGNLPMAIAMCSRLVPEDYSWIDLERELRNANMGVVQAGLPQYPHRALHMALSVSLEALKRCSSDLYERYIELAIFPGQLSIPLNAIKMLWTDHVPDTHIKRYANQLVGRCLLEKRSESHYTLHDVLRLRLKEEIGEYYQPSHLRLFNAYKRSCSGRWTQLDDEYALQYLPYHLREADADDQLYRLFSESPEWLNACFASRAATTTYWNTLEFVQQSIPQSSKAEDVSKLIKVFAIAQSVRLRLLGHFPQDIRTLIALGRVGEAFSTYSLGGTPLQQFDRMYSIVIAFQKQGKDHQALLDELVALSENMQTSREQRMAFFLLAFYYLRAGDFSQAEKYALRSKKPDLQMAIFISIAEEYDKLGDERNRTFWRSRCIELFDASPSRIFQTGMIYQLIISCPTALDLELVKESLKRLQSELHSGGCPTWQYFVLCSIRKAMLAGDTDKVLRITQMMKVGSSPGFENYNFSELADIDLFFSQLHNDHMSKLLIEPVVSAKIENSPEHARKLAEFLVNKGLRKEAYTLLLNTLRKCTRTDSSRESRLALNEVVNAMAELGFLEEAQSHMADRNLVCQLNSGDLWKPDYTIHVIAMSFARTANIRYLQPITEWCSTADKANHTQAQAFYSYVATLDRHSPIEFQVAVEEAEDRDDSRLLFDVYFKLHKTEKCRKIVERLEKKLISANKCDRNGHRICLSRLYSRLDDYDSALYHALQIRRLLDRIRVAKEILERCTQTGNDAYAQQVLIRLLESLGIENPGTFGLKKEDCLTPATGGKKLAKRTRSSLIKSKASHSECSEGLGYIGTICFSLGERTVADHFFREAVMLLDAKRSERDKSRVMMELVDHAMDEPGERDWLAVDLCKIFNQAGLMAQAQEMARYADNLFSKIYIYSVVGVCWLEQEELALADNCWAEAHRALVQILGYQLSSGAPGGPFRSKVLQRLTIFAFRSGRLGELFATRLTLDCDMLLELVASLIPDLEKQMEGTGLRALRDALDAIAWHPEFRFVVEPLMEVFSKDIQEEALIPM